MYPASFFVNKLTQRGTKNENDNENENYYHPDEELKLMPMLTQKSFVFV